MIIIPFRKHHAGKEFRGVWVGIGIGVLMFGLLFLGGRLMNMM
jgi:hypothetical protein